MKCIYGDCEWYRSVDDGEDENGNPYSPNPYCLASDTWLDEYPYISECPCPEKCKQESDV